MKCDIQDVVTDIRTTPGFQNQVDAFILSALRFVFDIETDESSNDNLPYNELLQIASIFSMSDVFEDRRLAYMIAIYIWLMKNKTSPELIETIEVILSRLSNFPAVTLLHSMIAPENISIGNNLFTQLEILGKRSINSSPFLKNLVLTDFQKQLWDYLDNNNSVSFSAPTSAGKSFVLKQYIVKKTISNDKIKILYILPTRALINEAITELREYIKQHATQEEILLTSIPTVKPTTKKVIYILTQERADILINSETDIYFDLIVVDEAQQISSSQRGIILQDVLSELLTKNPDVPIIFSCPFIKNTGFFEKIFNKRILPLQTNDGTVIQNLISVNIANKQVKLNLLQKDKILELGKIDINVRKTSLPTRSDRLSFLAEKFTDSSSKSIIFANGPDDAEKIANKLYDKIGQDIELDKPTQDLIDYTQKHLHKDFSLVLMLKRGIAFHYGNLPTIIRVGIEDIFKQPNGKIKYLICTSTLLEGVNLPAKNIFIESPKKGNQSGAIMSAHDFWNLAGRAGRLAKDLYGNIFLINYEEWEEPLANTAQDSEIKSALYDTIYEYYDNIKESLLNHSDYNEPKVESAINKLFLEYKKNNLSIFLGNSTHKLSDKQKEELFGLLKKLDNNTVKLPDYILRKNPHISILKQQDLYEHLMSVYNTGNIDEYIPIHPLEDTDQNIFGHVMRTANKYLSVKPIFHKHLNRLITLSSKWMQGVPVAKMINDTVLYWQENGRPVKVNTAVRHVLEWIEKDIRFYCMIRIKCYIDILSYILEQQGDHRDIPPIHLFMEMGASQLTRISLMGIGLSRPTANVLNELIANNDMSEKEAYSWLLRNFDTLEQRGITGLTLSEIKKFI